VEKLKTSLLLLAKYRTFWYTTLRRKCGRIQWPLHMGPK